MGSRAKRILDREKHTYTVAISPTRESKVATRLWNGRLGSDFSIAEGSEPDVALLAGPVAHQLAACERLLSRGISVVSTAGDPEAVKTMWSFGNLAARSGVSLVVGAASAPGISSLIASHLHSAFDRVSDIHIYVFGTGGPACAREHHRSMSRNGNEVRDSRLMRSLSGSGRSLVYFPEPVGPADCYFAALADPFLLHLSFPDVERIQARSAATRRDRLTARLPMMRRPHPEGRLGGVVVEVRGTNGGSWDHRMIGTNTPVASGAASMAALACQLILTDAIPPGVISPASFPEPGALLQRIQPQVPLWTYTDVEL